MNSRVTIILVIMAIYLAGMLWIGLKGRKYSETNKDFMTAAKQGSMLLVVGSYLGSHLGNGVVVGVLQTKVNRKNEKSPAKFTRPKMGITKQAGEKSHRQPG